MKTKSLKLFAFVLPVLLVVLAGIALLLILKTNGPLENEVQPLFGWQQIDGKTYYYDPETGLVCTGWLELTEGTYYLDENGSPTIGLLPCPERTYYFDSDGRMVTGWATTTDGKRYFGDDGTMAVGFLDLGDKTYYFGQDGVMCTGWQKLQGQRYYFDETGAMVTAPGWLRLDIGTWYLKEDGQPYTGWMQTDEARYYFLEDGAMAVGAFQIDGVSRYFSSDGNYIPLVNPWNKVPEDYTPRLVDIENQKIDSTCVDALKNLIADARNAGLVCILNSGHRDISIQTYLWNRRYNDYISQGYSPEDAHRLSARRVAYPGTSEHQTGLAIDIVEIVEDGTLYEWFRQHAWEYGFTIRYREDKEPFTGIMDEPWHLRYVGKEVAQILQENSWCLEEFLNQFAGS